MTLNSISYFLKKKINNNVIKRGNQFHTNCRIYEKSNFCCVDQIILEEMQRGKRYT